MSDTCTLILITTLLAVPCKEQKKCSMTMDGSKQICMSYCEPAPQTYSCTKPDGSSYLWQPKQGEDTVLLNVN
jgi:hypothetical protein